MSRKQLYSFSREDFRAYFHTKRDGTPMTAASGVLPFMFWPNGRWCIEVNLFLQDLYDKGLSTEGQKGGTLGTYTAYLSHLLRLAYTANLTDFSKMTNNQFRLFVNGLNAEKVRKSGGLVPKRNPVVQDKIVCVWLDFLEFVGSYSGRVNFVGKEGTIRAYKRPYKKKIGRDRYATGERWSYPGRPRRRKISHRRLPVTDSQFVSLKSATDLKTKNPFIRRRRLVMFVLFDALGPRRREIALLDVKCIRDALHDLALADAQGDQDFIPMMRFRTVKTGEERECPISRVNLRFIESYIDKFRNPLVRKKNPKELLDGPLLVNSQNGKRLADNFFTLEFYIIRLLSGIKGKASPHMMRHRFITKLFVRLVLAHNIETTDALRRLLLSTQAIKEHVRQITGHQSVESLEIYIHLAIDEVTEFRKTLGRITNMSGFDALADARNRFIARVTAKDDATEAAIELATTVDELLRSYGPASDFKDGPEWASVLADTAT